jgi:hypothetical protein
MSEIAVEPEELATASHPVDEANDRLAGIFAELGDAIAGKRFGNDEMARVFKSLFVRGIEDVFESASNIFAGLDSISNAITDWARIAMGVETGVTSLGGQTPGTTHFKH